MRILSVVTLVSPQGEYGGPVRVAVNQLRALADRGHEVLLLAASSGFPGTPPRTVDGVPAALFPARRLLPGTGFAGLTSPGLLRALPGLAGAADVVHVHLARDLVTLPAAHWVMRHRVPYLLQTHGMVDASSQPLAVPLDAVLTRPVLHRARWVLHLTDVERTALVEVAGSPLRLRHLPNGVPAADEAVPTGPAEVLYLARLAPRKRPQLFVEMAGRLAARHPDVRFRLVGPDEGEGPAVRALVEELAGRGDVRWEGPVPPEQTLQRMSAASVYVLPSVDEPYPMSVLEAMSVGLPVVVTDSCGLAGLVRRWDAGLVVDDRPDSLVAAVDQLLSEPQRASAMGARGRRGVRDQLSMASVAEQLEDLYR